MNTYSENRTAMENSKGELTITDKTDSIDSYFECITACSLDEQEVECVTTCVEVHLKEEC